MGAEETKHDLWLKRAQIAVGILAGVATLIVGIYNVKKTVFSGGKGELAVTVVSGAGKAMSRPHVDLYGADNALLRSTEGGEDGKFLQKDLDAGSYNVKISHDGFESQTLTVRVDPKRTTDLDVTLQPLPGHSSTGSQIQSALDEVGASWIKNLGKPKTADATGTEQKK